MNHWPEDHKFQPLDTEDLRGWLLCKAGWCDQAELVLTGSRTQMINAMTAFMVAHRARSRSYIVETRDGLRCYWPRSIKVGRQCPDVVFARVFEQATRVLEETIGVPIEQLKREKAA